MSPLHYLDRRYLGWLPVQFCMMCRNPYWGGWPRPGWRAWMMEWCSRECANAEINMLGVCEGSQQQ